MFEGVPPAQVKSLSWNSILVMAFHVYPMAESHLSQETQPNAICSKGMKKFDSSRFTEVKAMATMNAIS